MFQSHARLIITQIIFNNMRSIFKSCLVESAAIRRKPIAICERLINQTPDLLKYIKNALVRIYHGAVFA